MSIEHCPSSEQLEELLLGRTSVEIFARWESHLASCRVCLANAERLRPQDRMLEDLAAACTLPVSPDVTQVVVEAMRRRRSGQPPQREMAAGASVDGAGLDEEGLDGANDPRGPYAAILDPPKVAGDLGHLAHYRVLSVLGEGGMGVVFLAEDEHLLRRVALKVIHAKDAANAHTRQRLLNEARSAASLKHDHIVTIYEVGQSSHQPYIAMELLSGMTLKERLLKEGALPVKDALRIAKQVASGLACAHRAGLMHRDIKPENIWWESRERRAKILDFGLVRAVDDDTGLTIEGMVVGTPRYMSPEQASGSSTVGPETDLFSLGAVLFEMLTGKSAFRGPSVTSTLLRVSRGAGSVSLAGIEPEGVRELLESLLHRDPEMRPHSADFVVRLLGLQLSEIAQQASGVGGAENTGPRASGLEITGPDPSREPWFSEVLNRKWVLGLVLVSVLFGLSAWGIRMRELVGQPGYSLVAGVDGVVVSREIQWPATAPPLAEVPFTASEALALREAWAAYLGIPGQFRNSIGMDFVLIPPGAYQRGDDDPSKDFRLRPKHRVEITRPYYLAVSEVTEWEETVAQTGVVLLEGSKLPASLSWHEAGILCERLQDLEPERRYRLPTEAEWEFAHRAGRQEGSDEIARAEGWFLPESEGRFHPVKTKVPNPWGLYDMYGNAEEWCSDWFSVFPDREVLIDPLGPPSWAAAALAIEERGDQVVHGPMRPMRGGNMASDLRENSWDWSHFTARRSGFDFQHYAETGARLAVDIPEEAIRKVLAGE